MNSNGTVTIEEYNSKVRGGWNESTFANGLPTGGYIHFKDINPTPTPVPANIVAPQSAGFAKFGTPSYWKSSGLGLYGTGLYCYTGGAAIDNWVRWTFDLNALNGNAIYKVEAYIPSNYATTTRATYHISTAGGQQDRVVNQLNISGWADLGTHAFNVGSASVVLHDDGEPYVNSSSPKIGFDCMRLTYVGPVIPPPPPRTDFTPPVTVCTGVDSRWHRTPVTYNFAAHDNTGGSGVARTEYRIDAGAWKTGTACTVPAPANHTMDGKHTVYYRSADAAGNVEALKSAPVRIDTLPPTGAVRLNGGAAATRSAAVSADSQASDIWGPLEMRFSVDGKASWTAWQAYAARRALTLPGGAGLKMVYAQYRDGAGNLTERADAIVLDVLGPLTRAQAASGRVGRGVALRYLASDDQSTLVWALRVVVKNAQGRTVKDFRLGASTPRSCGVWYSFRWRPKAVGTYRYSVFAKDAAGNQQSRVGSARVVVR